MKSFSITIDNGTRRQEFTQEYGNEGYARLSLYHVMSNMLDSAIKESFKESDKVDLTQPTKELMSEPSIND